mgnify:FL=1
MSSPESLKTEKVEEIRVEEVKKLKDIFICPLCGEKMESYRSKPHMETHIVESQEYTIEKEYVTPCGCRFNTEEKAKRHIETNKKYCGYYKYAVFYNLELYHVKHVIDDQISWGREPKWYGVKIEAKEGINEGHNSYGPFVNPPYNSKYTVKLRNETERISKSWFYAEAKYLFNNVINELGRKDGVPPEEAEQ